MAHEDIERWLSWLMTGFGDGVLELRIFPQREKTVLTGYFRTPEAAVKALEPWDGHAQIYAGLNPRIRKVWRQAPDMLRPLQRSGSKEAVAAIHHVLLDFDPERPAGVPSSQDELLRARDRAKAVAQWLEEQGARKPLAVSSGNGFHLLYKIPPQDSQTFPRRLKAFLQEVAQRFGSNGVDVDQKVWDAPRIVKVGGTVSVKGTPSKDRPHRRARIAQMVPAEPDEGLLALLLRYENAPPRASPNGRYPIRPAKGADPQAVADLVAPYWTSGNRHAMALGLAGMLAKAGWSEEKAIEAIEQVARAAGDEEVHDRIRAVQDTYRGLQEDKTLAGAAILEGALPPQAFQALKTLVRASRGRMGKTTPLSPIVSSLPPDIHQILTAPAGGTRIRMAAAMAAIHHLRSQGYADQTIRLLFAQYGRGYSADLIDHAMALSHGKGGSR